MVNFFKNFFIYSICMIFVSYLILGATLGKSSSFVFFSIIMWFVFMYIIIKKHPIIAVTLSFVYIMCAKVMKDGIDSIDIFLDALFPVVFYLSIGVLFYKLIFGNSDSKASSKSKGRKEPEWEDEYEDNEDEYERSSYRERIYEQENISKLEMSSAEYYDYLDAAKQIHEDYCDATCSSDEERVRVHARRLKATMIGEYGRKDDNVRYIIENYLNF